MTEVQKITATPVISNTHDMRVYLIQQMIKVAEGELEPMQVAAIAKVAQQIYNFGKLELQAAKVRAQHSTEEIKALDF